jgi:hypothetical protein
VTITASPNTGQARTGTVTITSETLAPATVTITQEETTPEPPPATITASPEEVALTARGAPGIIVSVASDSAWRLESRPSWMQVGYQRRTTLSVDADLWADPNFGTERSGEVVFANATGERAVVQVRQKGTDAIVPWNVTQNRTVTHAIAPTDDWHVYEVRVPEAGWWSFVHDAGPWAAGASVY